MSTPRRSIAAGWPVSRLLLILAVIFFVIDSLLAGGVITGGSLDWLLPAGLASLALSFLVP
jgi:hypothetical protein